MKYSTIYLLLLSLPLMGQLATINDPDGYTNVRAEKSVQSKINARLVTDDMFTYDPEDTGEWVYIERGEKLSGYIHKSRFMPVDSLPHIPVTGTFRVEKENSLIIHNDSMRVTLTTAPFVVSKHMVQKDKEGTIGKIDGALPIGTDGFMPREQLTSLKLFIHDREIAIPAAAYTDLFEPHLHSFNVYFNKGSIYLYMSSVSDGAASCSMVWIIKNGKYSKRYFDSFQ
jgi:hypothetical protein